MEAEGLTEGRRHPCPVLIHGRPNGDLNFSNQPWLGFVGVQAEDCWAGHGR